MAEENNQAPASSGKGLMIVLIALIFVLILAVVGVGYFVTQSLGASQNPQSAEEANMAVDKGVYYKADLNELVLNLTDSRGREKLMKLSFSIKSTESNIENIVEDYRAEIIDVVISQIGARSSEELLTVGGKNLLKDELVIDINNVLNSVNPDKKIPRDCVKTILFTTFVIK